MTDLPGQRFGKLLVQGPLAGEISRPLWVCLCDCGKQISVQRWSLTSGNTQSCGCSWRTRTQAQDLERLLGKIQIDTATGCWCWLGQIEDGYGRITMQRKNWLAHRASYILHGREIPEGLEVDHLCKNTRCVNPEHLEAVPGRVNNARSSSMSASYARRTACKNGHEYTADSHRIDPTSGARKCRVCERERRTRREVK